MEPKQMLEAVIEKAIKNGYQEGGEPFTDVTPEFLDAVTSEAGLLAQHWILFNHDFAKAYFKGEHAYCNACGRHHETYGDCDMGCGNNQEAWEFHLQQAVLSEDPLLYYYQHP